MVAAASAIPAAAIVAANAAVLRRRGEAGKSPDREGRDPEFETAKVENMEVSAPAKG
jgi:hypothetical protein